MKKLLPYRFVNKHENPTIVIYADSPDWESAYKTWLTGKNPTDSKEWKSGVFLQYTWQEISN